MILDQDDRDQEDRRLCREIKIGITCNPESTRSQGLVIDRRGKTKRSVNDRSPMLPKKGRDTDPLLVFGDGKTRMTYRSIKERKSFKERGLPLGRMGALLRRAGQSSC